MLITQLKKMPKVNMVDGCFDPLHHGHILYFKKASQVGLPVFCNVTGDSYLSKKHKPLLKHEKRVLVIDSIKYITYTYKSLIPTYKVLQILQPNSYIKGNDWKKRGLPSEELDVCNKYNIKIVFLDTVIDSSSNILKEQNAQ